MLDPAITKFFDERKTQWLKKKLTASLEEHEKKKLQTECDQLFSPNDWLPNAARRAGQISITTHPCTFSHPSARKNRNGYVTSVMVDTDFESDGFLKSGNVSADTDALGNAAALDVYKYLSLEMSDGQQLLSHIQQHSALAKEALTIDSASYDDLRQGFLAITDTSHENVTSSKIKQVFFPVDSDYHQLSLLTNSGIAFRLRSRIDALRFSDETKSVRELKRTSSFSEVGFSEIPNLTTIGYGGTKPQNISVLNNQNGGKVHLLRSLPPTLDRRLIHFPNSNFFTETLHHYDCADVFIALHKILTTGYNNIRIREGLDYRLQELLDRMIEKMWAVRSVAEQQYHPDSSRLKAHQKTWLCEGTSKEREESVEWLDRLSKEIANWIIRSYEKSLGAQAIKMGEEERQKIVGIVEQNKESLR